MISLEIGSEGSEIWRVSFLPGIIMEIDLGEDDEGSGVDFKGRL